MRKRRVKEGSSGKKKAATDGKRGAASYRAKTLFDKKGTPTLPNERGMKAH